jgi:hypothetical protein|tara:strand:- start:590 stop:1384 length:795 start_codon:yes stop_codon:yes gene_type:complete
MKKELIVIDAGIGDACTLTSALTKLNSPVCILTSWPYIFNNNPNVIKIYDARFFARLGNHKDFFKSFDTIQDMYPYADKTFLTTNQHIIDYCHSIFNLPNSSLENEFYINEQDYTDVNDYVDDNLILFQWSGNTHDEYKQVYKSLSRSNAQEIVDYLNSKNLKVLEVRALYQKPLQNTITSNHLSYKEYLLLTQKCRFFVSIDSCLQHFSCNKFNKKKGLVLWGTTSYKKYGYEHNINLQSELPNSMFFEGESLFSNIDKLINE